MPVISPQATVPPTGPMGQSIASTQPSGEQTPNIGLLTSSARHAEPTGQANSGRSHTSYVEVDVHELAMLLEGIELRSGRTSKRWEPSRHERTRAIVERS